MQKKGYGYKIKINKINYYKLDYLLTGLYIFIGISVFLNIFTKLFYEEIL